MRRNILTSLLLMLALTLGLCACGGEASKSGSDSALSEAAGESTEQSTEDSAVQSEGAEESAENSVVEGSVEASSENAGESAEDGSSDITSESTAPDEPYADSDEISEDVSSMEESETSEGDADGIVFATGRGVMGSDGAEGYVYSADSVNCLDNWERIVESYGEDSLYYVLIFTDSTQYRRQVKEYNESLILSEEHDENGKLISRSFKEYSFADTVAAHRQRYEADLAMLKDFGIEGELQWISATDKRVDHPRSDNALCHYAFAAYARGGELLEYIRKAEIGGFVFLMPKDCTANRFYWGSLWWQDEETKQTNELYGTDDWMAHAGSAAGPISQYLSYDPSF